MLLKPKMRKLPKRTKAVSKRRKMIARKELAVRNAFCPTGEGGGQDNSCSSHGKFELGKGIDLPNKPLEKAISNPKRLPKEVGGHRVVYLEEMNNEGRADPDGTIKVGPKFFKLDVDQQNHVLIHEWVHQKNIETSVMMDNEFWDRLRSGKMWGKPEGEYNVVWGPGGNTPNENIVETTIAMVTEPGWVKEKYSGAYDYFSKKVFRNGGRDLQSENRGVANLSGRVKDNISHRGSRPVAAGLQHLGLSSKIPLSGSEQQADSKVRGLRHIQKKPTVNAFCPTGEGGGQDNSCSSHGGGSKVIETPEFKKWFGDSKVVDAQGKPAVVWHSSEAFFTAFDPAKIGSGFKEGYDGIRVIGKDGQTMEYVAFHPTQIKSTENRGTFDAKDPIITNRKRLATVNAKRNPLKADPTRTASLRRRFIADLTRRFNILKRRIYKLIVEEDAFGLKSSNHNPFTANANFSSTQVNVDDAFVEQQIKRIQAAINPSDIVELEDEPHVTVRYGLHDQDSARVEKLLSECGPIYARLGRLSLFKSPEQDVLKIDVRSNQMDGLNRRLKLLPNTETFREYHPHLTIAYLKPGTGQKYLDIPTQLEHSKLLFKSLVFSNKDREKTELMLTANAFCPTGPGGGIDPTCSLSPQEASSLISKIRGGDERSKNKGDIRPEQINKSQVIRQVPLKSIPQSIIESLRESTDRARVAKYATQKIDTPVVLVPLRKTSGFGVSDGGHRILAAIERGDTHINAIIPADSQDRLTANTRFKFHTTSEQVEAFRQWLAQQTQYLILGTSLREIEDAWWKQYVMEGYEKGAGRAFSDVRKPKTSDNVKLDFFNGTKDQFLRESFAHPVSVDKVKLLSGRVYTELKGVTEAMSQNLVRTLTDGLVQGDSPREIARDINERVDGIGRQRADVIARTEIIRAHADGQLNALRDLGVEQVGVLVEFSSTQDDLVCPECEALEGIVITIDEAEGQIPVHPQCRCAWIPANVGEDEKDQVRGKEDVDDAIEEANDLGADIDSKISKERPESILNFDPDEARDEKGEWTSGGGTSEGKPESYKDIKKRIMKEWPRAGKMVGGLRALRGVPVPNTDSISASMTDYEELPGIREVPLSAFKGLGNKSYSTERDEKVDKLAARIKKSGKIVPLIVVYDKHPDNPSYILEGGHRSDALARLGVKSLPALVVLDRGAIREHSKKASTKNSESILNRIWNALRGKRTDNAFCPTGLGGGVDDSCSPGGGPSGIDIGKLGTTPHDEWKNLKGDSKFIYHATNLDNLHDISQGKLEPHKPSFGTDQREWPDGSREKRSYFSHEPSIAWQFAPEEGKPVLLRIPRGPKLKQESTGDYYTTAHVGREKVEVSTKNGWVNLSSGQMTENAEVMNVATVNLFVYGTFKDAGTLDRVAGRDVSREEATLDGYRHDTGTDGYSYLRRDPSASVPGFLVRLTPQELQKTDRWETRYEREWVTLKDGTRAWAYFIDPKDVDKS